MYVIVTKLPETTAIGIGLTFLSRQYSRQNANLLQKELFTTIESIKFKFKVQEG